MEGIVTYFWVAPHQLLWGTKENHDNFRLADLRTENWTCNLQNMGQKWYLLNYDIQLVVCLSAKANILFFGDGLM